MNKIFKVIWSRTKNCYVTASELAKGHTKSASTGSKARRKLLTSAAALAMVLTFAGGGNAWASVTVNTTDPGTPATVYTTEEVDNALGEKANSTDVASTYATKTEVADTYATKSEVENTYATKTALTEGLAEKANSDDVANTYATKSELESGLDGKLDVSEDGDVSVSGDLDVTGAISGDSLDVDDGAISGGSLDVGDGTITGGAISGDSLDVTNDASVGGDLDVTGEITGTTLTDGTATLTGGNLNTTGTITGGTITGTSVSAGEGEISGGSLDVDTGSIGTVNIADNGDVTGVKDLTATGTLTGTSGVKDGTLTDGTYVLKESTVGENLNALDTQVDANADAITTETSARKTADTALVGAVNGGIVVGADNVLMKNTTTIEDGVVSNTQSAVDTLIMNQGAANQITLSQNGIKVGVSSWRQRSFNAIPPAVKSSASYMNSILAKKEATLHGYAEAIMLNEEGRVCEGTGENIFVVRNGILSTPPLSDGLLPDLLLRNTILMKSPGANHSLSQLFRNLLRHPPADHLVLMSRKIQN